MCFLRLPLLEKTIGYYGYDGEFFKLFLLPGKIPLLINQTFFGVHAAQVIAVTITVTIALYNFTNRDQKQRELIQ